MQSANVNCTASTYYRLENLTDAHLVELIHALELANTADRNINANSPALRTELICELNTARSMAATYTKRG